MLHKTTTRAILAVPNSTLMYSKTKWKYPSKWISNKRLCCQLIPRAERERWRRDWRYETDEILFVAGTGLAQKNDSMLPMNRWCMHGRYLAYATIKYFHLASEYIRVLLGTAKIALVVVLCNMYYYPQIRLFKLHVCICMYVFTLFAALATR